MNIRFQLIDFNLKYTKLTILVENVYYCKFRSYTDIFFIARVVLIIFFFFFMVLPDPKVGVIMKVVICLAYLYTILMIRSTVASLRKRKVQEKEMKLLDIEYDWFSQDDDKLSVLTFYKPAEFDLETST
jgi:hypothetical protein